MSGTPDSFPHLGPAARATAGLASRSTAVTFGVTGLALALGWGVLAGMAARGAKVLPPEAAGPGAYLVSLLPDIPLPLFLERFFILCLTPSDAGGSGVFVASAAMWMLMSTAMMLPSAAPLVRTYCEIADTAAAKGMRTVHPLVLVTGYCIVWLAAGLAFALLALVLGAAGSSPAQPAPVWIASGALFVAGAYQFSSIRHACLTKCRNPFSTLFGNWSTNARDILVLGMRQGAWCLGCCWALMLVMLAVGVMNVFWMVLLGTFALVEKQVGGKMLGRLAGAILLVWAAALPVSGL